VEIFRDPGPGPLLSQRCSSEDGEALAATGAAKMLAPLLADRKPRAATGCGVLQLIDPKQFQLKPGLRSWSWRRRVSPGERGCVAVPIFPDHSRVFSPRSLYTYSVIVGDPAFSVRTAFLPAGSANVPAIRAALITNFRHKLACKGRSPGRSRGGTVPEGMAKAAGGYPLR
jgi:hypothetical protein